MADTAAHLVDRVLPPVPYRQWVLSMPRRIRFALARHPPLLSDVLRIFVRKLSAWQRRRGRALGIAAPHTGAITFVQRFGSLLNLNCHFHTLVPDGVFALDADDRLDFHALPPPLDHDVDRLLRQIARAIHRWVEHRLAHTEHDALGDDGLALDQRDALGVPGPAWAHAAPERTGRLNAFLAGYSLHAARAIAAHSRDALERLCRYGARAPVANKRLSREPDGTVALALRKPLRDGRTVLRFSPLDFLRRLVTLIPPPRANLTRYHGVFAPNHSLRSRVVRFAGSRSTSGAPSTHRPDSPRRRLDWAALLRRVFALDVLRCDTCGGAMRILAVLCESDVTRAILDHLADKLPPPSPRALDPPLP